MNPLIARRTMVFFPIRTTPSPRRLCLISCICWDETLSTVTTKMLLYSAEDGQLLATGGTDGAIRLLRISDRRELFKIAAHKNTAYCVAFNPAGNLLASSGFDSTIHIWEVRSN